MMSGSKAPDFDAYGLFRATHSHVSAPLRSVLDMCHWHIAPYPTFAKPHDKSCFLAARQLILLMYGAVTLFKPPCE